MPEIKIFDALPEEEILAQMAEECVEASKAALKLRRVRCGVNPTPVSEKDAFENLVEELADIYLCSIVFFGGELDDNDPCNMCDAVGDRMFFANNPFEAVRGRTDLNGLQKLREVIRLNQEDSARTRLTVQAIPITKNPRLLVEMIASNRRILTPHFLELIEEGNRDGSIHTAYAREIAELLPLLTSLWLLPSVFPATKVEMRRKFSFLGDMLEKMGIPLMDDTVYALVDGFLEQLPDGE